MTVTPFNPKGDLIVVTSKIWGRERFKELLLAVDTGSASTMISSDVVEELGYHPRDGVRITSVHSAVGTERGYMLEVARFATLGFELAGFVVDVFDLPSEFGIDGLVGLSFLRNFDYEVRSLVGRIRTCRAVDDALPS